MAINYNEKIPNNVNLTDDRTLQRALEHWQPKFLQWWQTMGPSDFAAADIYLRTAVGVDAAGWASYGEVRMPDYRWGIFLADAEPARTVGFGDHMGEAAWQQVPGEYRSPLRRLIVTQGDTEPASVERHSGDADKPRILGTFNEPVTDWLSFFMFTYFTDRDGKYQLKSLAESAFVPLARTTRFMLTEEAHHMFVGETGLSRVIKRALEVMTELGTDDPAAVRNAGAIDLPTFQRYLNFWFSSSLDLFGSEVSSNAASSFATGLKGRPDESQYDDHRCVDVAFELAQPGPARGVKIETIPLRNAMNEVL